jgi:protocatechuate 3,4-dioxygenase beta subunit
VRTDGNGTFHVYGLWFDNYVLHVEAAGYLAWLFGGFDLTEQASGETIVLNRPATIAGKVTDHRGQAVPGAEVRLSWGATTETDDKGTYRITGLPPGADFRVVFPPPWGGQAGPITLEEGEVCEGVDLMRFAPVTVRLRVVDTDGQGLEGVTARRRLGLDDVASDATGSIEMHFPAETEGRISLIAGEHENTTVRFERLRPGATQDLGDVILQALPVIEVRVRLPDGTPPAEGTVGDIPLVDGIARVKGDDRYDVTVPDYPPMLWDVESPGPVLITLPVLHWIGGIVLDTDGGPVAGAEVDVRHEAVETVRTDDEGRFRIGPFIGGPVEVEASTATARSRAVEVVLGDGELELTVIATRSDLLRGRVLRGIRPVPRFLIEGTRVVDEEGRFQVLIRRAEKDWIEVEVHAGAFPFRLPPEGQELIARLPAGQVSVALEGAAPDKNVSLLAVGGVGIDISSPTEQDGIARFSDLEPGVYAAKANGFARTEFTLAAGTDRLVTLPATPQGTLSVRAPPGFKFAEEELHQTLNPGLHRDVLVGFGAYRIFLEAVRIVAGEETIVDLAPSDGGSLLIRGPPDTGVELLLRRADATLSFVAQLNDKEGTFRFPVLPRGSYAVRTPLRRLTVDIAAGDAAVLDLGTGAHSVADRVMLWNGKPAQGAEVHLFPADSEDRERSPLIETVLEEDELRSRPALTDLRGRFRFANVLPGGYTCVAELDGHAPASGTVTVAVDGVVTDGLPLTLVRSAHKHARLLGLAGEPLDHVPVRVDGHWQTTDVLGRLRLHTVPARIDLDHEGLASLRDLKVHAGDDIRLVRGATLVAVFDPEAGSPVVRIDGRPWRRLRPAPLVTGPQPGRLVLADLPPGPVEIQLPAPPAAEGEEEPPEPPEPVVVTLESGVETAVDLRPR